MLATTHLKRGFILVVRSENIIISNLNLTDLSTYFRPFPSDKKHWFLTTEVLGACDDSNLKNSEAWESPGPLRLLPILKMFKRTLGLRESPSGLGESRATEATANISKFQKDTGPPGTSQWPGKVLGHWGHWHFLGSPGHWAFGKVPVARQSPGSLRPLTFLGVTGSLGLRESPFVNISIY